MVALEQKLPERQDYQSGEAWLNWGNRMTWLTVHAPRAGQQEALLLVVS